MRFNFSYLRPGNNLLIANSESDLSDYKGNWIKQTSDILEIQSAEDNSYGFDVEFFSGHDILNTNEKDKLKIITGYGDNIRFEKREDEGLIPRAVHKSKGFTVIKNDKMNIIIAGDEFHIDLPESLLLKDLKEKYQSVAFELESDNQEINEKIRMNSYRQFVILDENDEERVTFNKYDLPISKLLCCVDNPNSPHC